MTAALKPLERAGLVETATDPDDRRSKLLVLTELGQARLAAALPVWHDLHARMQEVLPDPDAVRAGMVALS